MALVTLTPLKSIIIPPPPSLEEAEQNRIERMEGDKVETAAEQIRELRTADVLLSVEDLKQIRDEMAAIEKVKQEEFEKATGKKMEPPPPMDEKALAQLKAQAESKRKETERLDGKSRKAEEEADRLRKDAETKAAESKDAVDREKQLVDEIKRLRKEAHDKRREASDWEGKRQTAEREAQSSENEKNQKQNQANQLKDQAQRSSDEAKRLEDEAGKLEQEVNNFRDKEKLARTESDEKKKDSATRQQADQKAQEANQLRDQANQTENRARQISDQAKNSRKKETESKTGLEKVQKEIADKEKTAAEKRESQKNAGTKKVSAETEAVRLDQEANKLEQDLQALRQKKNELDNAANTANQIAQQKRSESEEANESARGAEIQANNMTSRVRREEKLRSRTDGKNEDLAQKDISDLYESARSMEDDITEIYRNIRAAELAMIRNMQFKDAVKMTDVATPPRPDLDKVALEKKITNGRDFIKYEKELQKVSQELGDMLSLANNLRGAAQGLTEDGKEGFTVSGDLAKEMAGALGKLEGQAGASKERGDMKDMTGLMENAYETAGAMGKKGSEGEGKAGAPEGLPGKEIANGDGDGKFKSVTSEPWKLNHKEGGGGSPRLYKQGDMVNLSRSISKDGEPSDWLFLDSWYVIGPFPNPERRNINKLFPPETVVDLDASYEGMNGQMVRWTFMQTGSPLLAPARQKEYAIYYFSTEMYSDEARDIWLLIGSDDQSKLWINGQLVWKSADIQKTWNIDEGYRKVRLAKGVNKILVRLENGWHSCGVSLGFYIRPVQ
ncbi:MAG TPA: hypothetical protein DET40_02945 [Lentisphaeria bacterium]|nr:MAG: hypothetical protein A2X45_14130 [Lentisphaerae bacterium GWF2_50_93]HCE42487.1 hypothetical protein [Lentisphaeria bacterium]